MRVAAASLALLLGLSAPAAAQRPAQPPPPRRLPPLPPEPPISFRPFVTGTENAFAAVETFNAVLGQSYAPFFGGGLQVVFQGKYYVEVAASRSHQTGSRAFRDNGQDFSLGIPVDITMTPLEITAGYRWRPRSMPNLRPYVGAGIISYGYEETSAFADPGDSLSTHHIGLVGLGGVEFRVHRYVGIAVDAELSHVGGILGQAGISKEVGESDLGGIAARFRLIVGR